MTEKAKLMISARLPASLVARVDFLARNLDTDSTKNRSAVVRAALETWVPSQELELERLGIIQKKAR